MNIIKAFLTLFIIGTVVITVLFIDFAYKTFSYRQNNQKADAIVVLAVAKGVSKREYDYSGNLVPNICSLWELTRR